MKLTEFKKLIREEVKKVLKEAKNETVLFSGYKKFMDSKAVLKVFADHGVDKSKMKRTYDWDSDTVELVVNINFNTAKKIGDALEKIDRNEMYGGWIVD